MHQHSITSFPLSVCVIPFTLSAASSAVCNLAPMNEFVIFNDCTCHYRVHNASTFGYVIPSKCCIVGTVQPRPYCDLPIFYSKLICLSKISIGTVPGHTLWLS